MDVVTLYALVAMPSVYDLNLAKINPQVISWYSHETTAEQERIKRATWSDCVVIPMKFSTGALVCIFNKTAGLAQ